MLELCRNYDKPVTDWRVTLSNGLSVLGHKVSRRHYLALCSLFLVIWLISVAQDLWTIAFELMPFENRLPFLDVDVEKSFYTWVSVCTLFLIGTMALRQADAIGYGQTYFKRWNFIGLVFIYLSADESLTGHEKLAKLGAMIVDPHGFFLFAWTVPVIAIVLLVVVACFKLVINLPPHERNLTFLSGAIYLGGAVGLEMVGGKLQELYGYEAYPYHIETSLEEAMEGIGMLIFMRVLILLERERSKGRSRLVGASAAPDGSPAAMHSDNTDLKTASIIKL
jgi:hypothetical protein